MSLSNPAQRDMFKMGNVGEIKKLRMAHVVTVNKFSGNMVLKTKGYKPLLFEAHQREELRRVTDARDRLHWKKHKKFGLW